MWRASSPRTPAFFEYSLLISGAPTRVISAFFEARALASWWQTKRSVTSPRPMGVFAVEWEPSAENDEVLGRLGGVFHGTVMEYIAGREFFVAEAWWMPPDGEPLGPMALEVSCAMDGLACRLRVRQSGFEDGPRWHSYYDVMSRSWVSSLSALKDYVETAQP
jgi:uncharacterized protein YndB with AHSA1/START domain